MHNVIRIETYADAAHILREPSFSAVDVSVHLRLLEGHLNRDFSTLKHFVNNSPFFLEGARHSRLHLLSFRLLSGPCLTAWRPMIEEAVESHLDRLPYIAGPDLVRDFIDPVSRAISGTILGFDATDASKFDDWIKQARDLTEPMLSLRRVERLQTAIRNMMDHIEQSPALTSPQGVCTVLGHLMHELSDDFTPRDAIALVVTLFVAAQATSQTLSNIVLAILQLPPSERAAVDPSWFAANMETLLRLHAAGQFVYRIASDEGQLGACPYRTGDHLRVHIPSVNRDPARPAPGHNLSFGAGAHKCPGAALGRLIVSLLLPRLFTRFSQLALAAAQPKLDKTTFLHAVAALPCTL